MQFVEHSGSDGLSVSRELSLPGFPLPLPSPPPPTHTPLHHTFPSHLSNTPLHHTSQSHLSISSVQPPIHTPSWTPALNQPHLPAAPLLHLPPSPLQPQRALPPPQDPPTHQCRAQSLPATAPATTTAPAENSPLTCEPSMYVWADLEKAQRQELYGKCLVVDCGNSLQGLTQQQRRRRLCKKHIEVSLPLLADLTLQLENYIRL